MTILSEQNDNFLLNCIFIWIVTTRSKFRELELIQCNSCIISNKYATHCPVKTLFFHSKYKHFNHQSKYILFRKMLRIRMLPLKLNIQSLIILIQHYTIHYIR